MPIKLLPVQLRLFNNPSLTLTRLAPMNSGQSIQASRATPIFNRVFPFKLKYFGLGFPVLKSGQQQYLGLRKFSTRPFRTRSSSSSEFPRSKDRGEVRASSKSLVEDEAELSEWISELKTDSFRGRATSDEENSDVDRRRNGGSSLKRRRESDSNGVEEPIRRRSVRSTFESFSKSSNGNSSRSGLPDRRGGRPESFSRNSQGNSDRLGQLDRRGGRTSESFSRNSQGNSDRLGQMDRRGGRTSESFPRNSQGNSDRFGDSNRRRSGNSSFESSSRMSKGSPSNASTRGRFESTTEGKGGSRGGSSSFGMMRGGRETELGYKRDQVAKGPAKRAPMTSEDEASDDEDDEEEKVINNFKDLLGEEDSDEDEDEVENEDADNGEDEDDGAIKKNASSLFGLEKEVSRKVSSRTSQEKDDSYLSKSRFDQCSVSPLSLKGIKDAGYENMTMVQEATLPIILKGKDVLAKAKTGTGKTVAFLLPSIEVVVQTAPVGRDQKRPPILVLVMCPTRELANQAAAEANKLLKYHPSIGVQVVIGGTRLTLEQKRMQANPCQILVATPGRLKDHIENTAGFATRLMGVKVLVLDEADHLLDMGFRKDIEKIIAAVPKQRQTLLFSATVPEEVRQICHIALKRDHEFINAVQEGSEETHAQVTQMHLVAPLDKHFSLVYTLLKEHISDDVDYKVLLFCTTAMVTRLVANLLSELNLNVREIHSRKPQSYRTRVSDEFRKSKGLILVTSDVSARGVDYPDVTLVIQVGLPSDREQYIHRLGRTGRKGKEGQGILLLTPWEEFFLSSIKDLPITKAPMPSVDPDTKKKVERALSQVEMKNKEAAYQAWLGYYNSVKNVGRDKHRLVELVNEFSRSMGLDNPPAIPKQVLGKMGLRNIPGLRSK